MSDLIHKIVGKIIEVGQSDTTKFRLGETIRYSPSEILEILKQHENEIFGEDPSTQPNTSNTLNALDCISRQEAIDAIRDYPNDLFNQITALEQLPSVQPDVPDTNVGDTISRQAAIDAVSRGCQEFRGIFAECEKNLNELPSAQPERKTGRWILWNYPGEECAICSACGEEYDQMELYIGGNDYPKYCPDCGAKMGV